MEANGKEGARLGIGINLGVGLKGFIIFFKDLFFLEGQRERGKEPELGEGQRESI